MSKSEKLTQFVIVICIAAIITAVGNVMDGKHLFSDSLVGVAILAFLATTTPVLAYAGLSLGKDLGAFRRLSWRIIPVALAVTAGTFICATALAQLVLHLEGLI